MEYQITFYQIVQVVLLFLSNPLKCHLFAVYQMAPCSWKPESSLEKTLPPDSVSVEVSDALRRVTESGQTGEQTSDIMLASAVNSHHPNRYKSVL